MEKIRFTDMDCPIARSLDRVGEWWSILILRDALGGMTRFDEFQKSLGIAPNMLTRRLAALVEAGMLEKRRYSERPPRDEYVLTDARDAISAPCCCRCSPSATAISPPRARASRWSTPQTGAPAEPLLIDAQSGRPLATVRLRARSRPRRDRGDESEARSPLRAAPHSDTRPQRMTGPHERFREDRRPSNRGPRSLRSPPRRARR